MINLLLLKQFTKTKKILKLLKYCTHLQNSSQLIQFCSFRWYRLRWHLCHSLLSYLCKLLERYDE